MRRRFKFKAGPEYDAKRLDFALADWLPAALGRPVSKAKIRKLIMAGAVYLNRSRMRNASTVLNSGAIVEADVDTVRLFEDSTAHDKEFELTAGRILFEDPDLIVIDKPPGLPSHPTLDQSRDNLFAAVTRFLTRRDKSAPELGIHQRLDRDTSGIMLFTKSRRVNAAVTEMFARHRALKTYQALTPGPRSKLAREWTIRNHLGKVSSKSKRSKYGAVDAGGDAAETHFCVIESYSRGLWIEAIPKTGRTHQIRVHLSEFGLPIFGDELYGDDKSAPRLMLHASRLVFPHPVTGDQISVESPLPQDFKAWLTRMRNSPPDTGGVDATSIKTPRSHF